MGIRTYVRTLGETLHIPSHLCARRLAVKLSSVRHIQNAECKPSPSPASPLPLTCRQHIHCPGHQIPQQPLHPTLVGTRVKDRVKLGERQCAGGWIPIDAITLSKSGAHIVSIQEPSGPKQIYRAELTSEGDATIWANVAPGFSVNCRHRQS